MLPRLETIFFPFVKQIRFGTSKVDNLRAAIALIVRTKIILTYIFLFDCALLAVIGVRDSRATTNNTATLVRAVVALIANSNKCWRSHVWVTDHTLSITLFTQTSNSFNVRGVEIQFSSQAARTIPSTNNAAFSTLFFIGFTSTTYAQELTNAWLLSAHNKVGVMLRHCCSIMNKLCWQ